MTMRGTSLECPTKADFNLNVSAMKWILHIKTVDNFHLYLVQCAICNMGYYKDISKVISDHKVISENTYQLFVIQFLSWTILFLLAFAT